MPDAAADGDANTATALLSDVATGTPPALPGRCRGLEVARPDEDAAIGRWADPMPVSGLLPCRFSVALDGDGGGRLVSRLEGVLADAASGVADVVTRGGDASRVTAGVGGAGAAVGTGTDAAARGCAAASSPLLPASRVGGDDAGTVPRRGESLGSGSELGEPKGDSIVPVAGLGGGDDDDDANGDLVCGRARYGMHNKV